ncbi:MAG: SpoIIE family protein phosphatase [Treponema sp.]|nr:SpoIIE family protein phosphatase [Treponema sp.]
MDLNNKFKSTSFQMCCFISLLIGIQGIVMAVICYKDSNLSVFLTSLSYSSLMFSTLIIMIMTKKETAFYITGPLMIIFIECYFLYSGGTDGFGVIWVALVPLFTVYLLPYGGFIGLNTVVLLILLIGLLTPLNKFLYEFSATFRVRFPILYVMEFSFSFFLKHRIIKTESELTKQKNILSSEINQAAAIQKTFLKQDNLEFSDWDTAFTCIPMAGVSGDLFDYYPDTNDKSQLLGLGIYDISGHGVSSGIISLLAKNIIHQEFYANLNLPLWEIVQNINDRFIEEKGEITNYITGIIVRTCGLRVELVNAGHLLPFVFRHAENKIYSLPNSNKAFGAIGLNSIPSFYDSIFLDMESGDELILFTDGITDCRNSLQLPMGRAGFQDILEKYMKVPSTGSQLRDIIYEISKYMDNTSAVDDMTLILLRKK